MASAFADAAHLGAAILFNSLWQGALIAGVTALALRLFPKANASTRYAAWSLALIALFVTPIATSLTRISVTAPPAAASTVTVHAARTTHAAASISARAASATHRESAPPTSSASSPAPRAWHLAFAVPSAIASIIFALWAVAALVVVVRLLVALRQLERLKNDALPLGVEHRETMNAWQRVGKGERDVRICVSDEIEVPVAIGLFDAMILLPQHLVNALDTSEIDQICLHELAHLLRGDDWSNGLQRLLCALMLYNPAAWFIGRQMDVEREVACDDFVLELTGAAKPYAFCLTKMAEMTAWPHAPLPAPGVFVTRKNISIRIERLLRSGRAIGRSITPSTATAVIAGLVAVIAVLRMVTPSIAFTLPAIAATPTAPATPEPVARITAHPSPAPARSVPAHDIRVTIPAQHIRIPALAIPAKTIAIPSEHIAVHVPPIHVPQVRIAQVERGCNGCNFSRAHLDGRDFSGQSLTATDFAYAHLRGANFDNTRLNGVNFHDADLRDVSFRNASLIGCNMHGARLAGVDLTGAHLNGCDIDISQLPPTQARNVLLACLGCSFAHADLHGVDLRGVHLIGANLRGADLAGADLRNASFDGVNFTGASLRGAHLDGASFMGCTFDGVDLRGVDLSHVQLSGSDLSHAILR